MLLLSLPKPCSASVLLILSFHSSQMGISSFWKRKLVVVLRVKLPLEAAARVILEDLGGNSGAFGHSCHFFPLINYFSNLVDET